MRVVRPLCTVLLPILLAGCDQLTAMTGPSEMVSFGFVRPVSCERRGPVSFNCVMRNHMSAPREANMECVGFDGQKRMVGRPKNVHAMMGVTLMPGEERVATIFYEKGVESLVCVDVRDSIPAFNRVQELIADPSARDITSVLAL
ncbi:hypothetical protein A7X61_15270 [Stenotrophomonas maltophilia]|nr:hypothetical protein A7X61_15270 [Stenotrophomonas maltophilia]